MMRRLANIGLLLAAAVLCYGLQTTRPHYADLIAPIPVYGNLKDDVALRTFTVRADAVTFACTLAIEQFGRRRLLTTGGVWAIVTVALSAKDSTTTIAAATWKGPGGLLYDTTERLSLAPGMPPVTVQPGLPGKGRLVFEIRPDEASEATLLVSEARYFALDSQAHIALGTIAVRPDGLPEGTVETFDLSKDL